MNQNRTAAWFAPCGGFLLCQLKSRSAGENIAYGQRTPQEVVTAWINSSGHRANILNSRYGKIGVGCYKNGSTYYWSQLFTD